MINKDRIAKFQKELRDQTWSKVTGDNNPQTSFNTYISRKVQ
jgi:hypothetical protein